MSNIKNAALAALFGMVLGAPSFALAQAKQADTGWYIGGHIGQADVKEASDEDTSFKILGGYQFNKNFAVEGAYIDFGKTSEGGTEFKANAWEAVAVGILPVGDRFGVYGKAGFFWGEAKGGGEKADSVELTYGVGVQFDLARNLGIRGEYQRYTDVGDGASDVDVISVGVVFRF
ncbi:MAG TPA: porin family protein [Burkholderiales bacterium]